MLKQQRTLLTLGGVLMVSVGALVALSLFINELVIFDGPAGYLMVAAIGGASSAAVVIQPVSVMPVIVSVAEQNNMAVVVLVYAAAASLGESTAYFFGRVLGRVEFLEPVHRRLTRWMKSKKRTGFILFLLASVPVPLFDFGAWVAGEARYPWRWFVTATFAGRVLKYWVLIVSWAWLQDRLAGAPLIANQAVAQAVMIAVIAVAGLCLFFFARRRRNWGEVARGGS